MKKTQVALAALALVASTAAMADGVTISGGIDIGMQNTTNGGSKMASGLLGINVVNVAASEDLGSGLKADLFVQHRFEAGNGSSTYQGYTGAGPFWNQSYVGLSGDFGSLKIGRQIESYALGIFAFVVVPIIALVSSGMKSLRESMDDSVRGEIVRKVVGEAMRVPYANLGTEFNGINFYFDDEGVQQGSSNAQTIFVVSNTVANPPSLVTSNTTIYSQLILNTSQ